MAADKAEWQPLWHGYLEFYQHPLSEAQTELTWSRLVDESFGMHGLVAELNGQLVGLAHYSFTHTSWEVEPYLYLEDLFVSPSVRGGGVGRALIAELVKIAKEAGSTRVWWETHRDNAVAQGLYEKVAMRSEFVKYQIQIG